MPAEPLPSLKHHPKLRQVFICVLLAGITLIAFWPVGRLGFTIYDDQEYVVKNPHVQAGINAETIGWAFTTNDTGNWHPVTWLSHMLDCQLFGLKAGDQHWMNLGFHTASAILLFLVLKRMTGVRSGTSAKTAAAPVQPESSLAETRSVWCSALVAALFALHPLRVESVAWISERKDVLSAFFMMLMLWAWAHYAQKPKLGKETSALRLPTSGFYWLALAFFALGLMSKPMLVTLPIILLLLDFWPLGRFSDLRSVPEASTIKRLLFEKLPFFLLCVASSIATFHAQNAGGSVVSLGGLPLGWRIENSLVSYVTYLGKIIWPENLALLYPIRQIPPWETFSSAVLLAGLSAFCLWRMRRQPYLFAGWFWFLIMLIPVIGLVQVGKESMADRYTYLPSIGLFIAVVWGMAGIASVSKLRQTGMILGGAAMLVACLAGARHQLNYWQDDVTLFGHSIEVTKAENYEGYLYLGNALVESGKLDAAVRSYESSLQIAPEESTHLAQANYNLGYVFLRQKKFQEAGVQFGKVLQLDYNYADAHVGLGHVLTSQNKNAEAETEYSIALSLRPDDPVIKRALAIAHLKAAGEKALTALNESLRVQPTADAHVQIAAIQTILGNFQDAVAHYQAALRFEPDSPDILNNLAWLLATCPNAQIRNGNQGVVYAEHACELTHYGVPRIVGTLAAAYAEARRFDDAVSTAQRARDLAEKLGEPALAQKNQELLKLYRANRPFHESTGP